MANDLEQKIIKQIEYYFGDYNLPRDKFLSQKVKENEGWIELDVLLTFKRLANLSTDKELILSALEKSENQIVAISEDRTQIRRVPEKPAPQLNDDRKKEIGNRTAYAKGFPADESLDDILNFLERDYDVDACMKRFYLDKALKEHKFKGSCFIVFKNLEECTKFIDAESIKYKDVELVRKLQSVYYDEKKNIERDAKNEKKKKNAAKEAEEVKNLPTYPKGAFLHFTGIAKDTVLTREEIKDKVAEVNETEPAYIDFKKGDEEGYLRMPAENGAHDFYKSLTDGILEVGSARLQCRVLEGEEEELYLKKTLQSVNTRRQQQKKNSHGNKRKGNYSDNRRAKKSKK